MSVVLALAILMAPFAVAAAVAWFAHRSGRMRIGLAQFSVSAPMRGRLSTDGADAYRLDHELDAIRTRFEQQPTWPVSGALGERR
jgi:hypothetical protein